MMQKQPLMPMRMIGEINRELQRQDELKAAGKFEFTAYDHLSKSEWHPFMTMLTEEHGEVARAINDNEPLSDRRKEMIQNIAVLVSALNGIDARGGV